MTNNRIKYNGAEYEFIVFTGAEIAEYKGLRDMYYGDGGFKDGSFLTKFPRESDDFFTQRKANAHYENVFRNELDAKVTPIFAKDQTRLPVNSVVDAFVANPTIRTGESMSEYQKRKEIHAKIFGAVFEVCDAPINTPDTGEGDLFIKEYAYYLTPLNIFGYSMDNAGNMNMLVMYESIETRDTADNNDSLVIRVFLIDKDGRNVTFRYENDTAVGEKFFDTFPVKLIEDNTRYRDNRIAKSKYISELSIAKTIYSLTSWCKDSFVKNCFAFLAVNQRLPQEVELGSDSIFQYVGEGVNKPEYVAPPTEHLKTMLEEAMRLSLQIQQNMNSTVAIASMASGEARMEADRRRIEELKQDARDIQDNEMWLVNTALKNYIDADYEYSVVYITDFESLTKSDELLSLQTLLDTGFLATEVSNEIVADMVALAYSNDKERAKKLSDMQRNSAPTQNNAFDNVPDIEDQDEQLQ